MDDQPPVTVEEPNPESVAVGVTCSRCGFVNPAGASQCLSPTCRVWLAGNPGRPPEHGLYSRKVVSTPDARASIEEKRAQIVADLGGPNELSQIKVDAINRYAEVDVIVRHLAGRLATEGIFTERGRTRAAYAAWLQGVDRWLRVAQLLGLERRTRRVDIIAEIGMARAEAEAKHAAQTLQDGPESTPEAAGDATLTVTEAPICEH